MAHGLNIENGKTAFAYAGARPWHGLGTKVPGHLTASEAVVAGGLDWTVSVRPLRTTDGLDVRGHYATVRDDTRAPLGVVKGSYRPVQNAELGSFLGTLFGQASACVETVGALGKGERIFLLAKVPHATFEARPGDPTEVFFLASSSHDCER